MRLIVSRLWITSLSMKRLSDEVKKDLIGYVQVYWNPVSNLVGSYVTGDEHSRLCAASCRPEWESFVRHSFTKSKQWCEQKKCMLVWPEYSYKTTMRERVPGLASALSPR